VGVGVFLGGGEERERERERESAPKSIPIIPSLGRDRLLGTCELLLLRKSCSVSLNPSQNAVGTQTNPPRPPPPSNFSKPLKGLAIQD
jgi:hypothetical protein